MKSPKQSESKDLVTNLIKKADELATKSISPQTQRAYLSDWRAFEEFCDASGLRALPASPSTVCAYLADRSDKRAPMTIERSVCAIGKIHEWQGEASPVKDPKVKLVMSGIKRSSGRSRAKSKPISIPMLKSIIDAMGQTAIDARNSAIILIGWFGAFRRSELVAIDHADLQFHDRGVIVTIARSKTDQEHVGVQIAIPRIDGSKYCPVSALLRWIERQSSVDGAVFTALGMEGRRWWLRNSDRGRLSDRMISKIVKTCMNNAGFSGKEFSGHSLRRGLATEAGRIGVPERYLQRHLRHASIQMVRSYIDAGNIWDENPLPAISLEF